MDVEEGNSANTQKRESWQSTLLLAYQSLGVVFGDISLSPLYVYENSFMEEEYSRDDILGVLSFIIWTLTLVPLFKYVFIVMQADDNGEGGTFALYSLLCRHSKVSLLPNLQLREEEQGFFENTESEVVDEEAKVVSKAKSVLENHKALHYVLLMVALFGSSMVIGDGSLVASLTVFSASKGLEDYIHKWVVVVACITLICLFVLQRYGTHKLGFMFAPIITTWLVCIAVVGIYNICTYKKKVYLALNPRYFYKFMITGTMKHWKSLGGILLCITGSEAMFADLGHFSQSSIKIAFTCMVYPALLLAYMGQAAYHLNLKDNNIVQGVDYSHVVPAAVRIYAIAIAMLASLVGSQAVITGTFSIIHQALALGCFPRVKVVHTSNILHGRIYIPEINWILMIISIAVTFGLRDKKYMGNACGLAVISVMLVTTLLMSLVIIICWKKSIMQALCFLVFFGCIETFYFSASIFKFVEGAWISLVLSLIFMTIMCTWHYVKVKKYDLEFQSKVSLDWLLKAGSALGLVRVPGIGLVYTEVATGIPVIFSHFVTNIPAIHQVLVFVSIKSLSVPHVPPEERYLVGRWGPRQYRIYTCIVRYGYRDNKKDHENFENQLIYNITEFISSGSSSSPQGTMIVVGRSIQSGRAIADEKQGSTLYSPSMLMQSVSCRDGLSIKDFSNEKYSTQGRVESMAHVNGDELAQENNVTMSHSPHALKRKKVAFLSPSSPLTDHPDVWKTEELQDLLDAKESGTAYILGKSHVKASRGSSLLKRFAIDVVYSFLKDNCRRPSVALKVPHAALLEVGMVYYI